MKRLLIPALVALFALLLVASLSSAQTGTILVTVSCTSTPESTTVTNNTTMGITVQSVGSIFQPRAEEPFPRNDQLAPGQSITYESGATASLNRLTDQEIFISSVAEEGVRVQTSAGTVEALCSAGTGSLVLGPAGPTEIEPVISPTATPVVVSPVEVPGATPVVSTGGNIEPVGVEPGAEASPVAAPLPVLTPIGGSAGAVTWARGYPQLAANGCVEYVAQWSDGSYTWVPFSCPPGVTYFKPETP